jgi:hypothetical protein
MTTPSHTSDLGKSASATTSSQAASHDASQADHSGSGSGMSGVTDAARKAAGSTIKAVAAQASQLASNITEEMSSTADEQKARGAEAIKGIAGALGKAASEFDAPAPMVADYMKTAAGQIEDLSARLKDKSIPELLTSAQNMARNQPALFFAGAVAAGFAVSRLLKSSAPGKSVSSNAGSGTSCGYDGSAASPQMHQGREDRREPWPSQHGSSEQPAWQDGSKRGQRS